MIKLKIICLGLFLSVTHITFAKNIDATTATDSINTFEKLFGITEGKRRNHTKGFCFTATLTPKDQTIKQYTKSQMFKQSSEVIGRLSHKGGNNLAPDHKPAEYGMGLLIKMPEHEIQLMSMNTLDFFPVATPEAFAQLMHAKVAGSAAVKAFKLKSKDLQRFKAHQAKKDKVLTPYEAKTYNSVNSFYLVDSKGSKTAIRWSFVPQYLQKIVVTPAQDFLFKNLQKNLKNNAVTWDMVITIANSEDNVDNAAIPWQGKHQQIIAAELTINAIQSEKNGKCDLINFDPLVLSTGFSPSADPLLQARRNAYAVSFARRLSEK
ncbi:MAG: catalase [Psychrobium sp.]|nr:catalase [Psychrobium sp.]